jgi:hypothetical protein
MKYECFAGRFLVWRAKMISPRFLLEEGMSVLEKGRNGLKPRMLRVEVILGIVGLPMLAWLAWLSIMLFSVKGDPQAIKQKIKDGGLGDIVSKLENPSSRQELAANLALVSSQVRLDRAEEKEPDREKMSTLRSAVVKAAAQNPDVPEVWQAASQIVSFRTANLQVHRSLPLCDTAHALPEERWRAVADGRWVAEVGYFYSHCTLDLATLPPQDKKGTYHFGIIDDGRSGTDRSEHISVLHIEPAEQYAQLPVYVDNGLVVSLNGEIPFGNSTFVFTNCKFELSVQSVPDRPLRELLLAGLSQPDLLLVNIGDVKPIAGS